MISFWFDPILINSLFSSLPDFNFNSEGAVPMGFLSLISWCSWFRHLLWAFALIWDSYLLLWMWSRIDLMFKGLCLCFVRIWSRIDLISELFCDPKSISHFNFILWLHVFPNRSHISQRGANVCTQKWSPRLWAPFIQFINPESFWSFINIVNNINFLIKS